MTELTELREVYKSLHPEKKYPPVSMKLEEVKTKIEEFKKPKPVQAGASEAKKEDATKPAPEVKPTTTPEMPAGTFVVLQHVIHDKVEYLEGKTYQLDEKVEKIFRTKGFIK